ncbi:hypothetical protein PAPYR_2530 [Paratrimastix pyriformis]|uniref:RING-type domain-containing protein n=1 Tax=Paratrimastix pyriformis TaxID=342808 RepID=A0ABQ8UWE4_9EUKA|nr:hypothetical protein PAPYR_2530 [Paratrimastix pyriformis]
MEFGPTIGFPTELFVRAVHPAMVCPICHCVIRESVTILCHKSHKSCKACCQRCLAQKAECPQCQNRLIPPYYNLDPVFDSLVQELLVRCPRRPCQWQGTLENFPRHQLHECAQRDTPHERFPRPEDPCPICGDSVTHGQIASHNSNWGPRHAEILELRLLEAGQEKLRLNEERVLLRLQLRDLQAQASTRVAGGPSPAPAELSCQRLASEGPPPTQPDQLSFDLRALIPIRLLGLACLAALPDLPLTASRRSASCRLRVPEAWTALGECTPPLPPAVDGQLTPVRFREPVALGVGEVVALKCTNCLFGQGRSIPENDVLIPSAGPGFSSSTLWVQGHFWGEIYYVR